MQNEKNRILFVEDDRVDMMAFERLVRHGQFLYDYVTAASVKEASGILESQEFDVVVTDFALGDGTAFDLFGKTDNAPIIVVTGTGDEEIAVQAMRSGAYDYMIKDNEGNYLKILSSTVQNAIDHKQSEDELERYRQGLEELVKERTAELQKEIAERKRAEQESERLNRELIAKNKELEQIIYVTSHDLRSPLVNIQGFSRELDYAIKQVRSIMDREDVPSAVKEELVPLLKEDIPESTQYIRASTFKMNTLLSGLLRLSRLGRAVPVFEELDMNKLASDIAAVFEFQIREANAILQIDELPSCRGDAGQINQLLSNLLDNALKYLDPARAGVIKISGRREAGRSVYRIEDNGIGIALEHEDRIFEIFHRLDPAVGTGEGLGLAIARKIIDRHNGEIWVKSEQNKGSKFFVSLPDI